MLSLPKNQKIRFIIAGGFNTVCDFIIFNTFLVGGLPALAANATSLLICMSGSYFINHYCVFRATSPVSVSKYMSFMAITGLGMVVVQSAVIAFFLWCVGNVSGLGIFNVLSDHSAIKLNVAKLVATAASMVWNYVLYKQLVFKRSKPNEEEVIVT